MFKNIVHIRDESKRQIIYLIFITVVYIFAFGIVMQASTGTNSSAVKHAVYAVAGVLIMFVTQFIDYRLLNRFQWLYYALAIACFLLLYSPLASTSHGASRWIYIGGVSIQIIEPVKLLLIIFLANVIKKYLDRSDKFAYRSIGLIWGLSGFLGVLALVISSNLSSAIILVGITFTLTFLFTDKTLEHVLLLAAFVAVILAALYYFRHHLPSPEELEELPYQVRRIAAFLSPEKYKDKYGYQIILGLRAIASGGWFGKGLGQGVVKFNLPEVRNDLIFAVIIEELGIFGGLLVVALYVYFLINILSIAVSCREKFGKILCSGIFVHFSMQILLHIAVTCNAIPNTGVSLPFISEGGSSILMLSVETGLVLSVYRYGVVRKSC